MLVSSGNLRMGLFGDKRGEFGNFGRGLLGNRFCLESSNASLFNWSKSRNYHLPSNLVSVFLILSRPVWFEFRVKVFWLRLGPYGFHTAHFFFLAEEFMLLAP
jgi:hypothetical protein